MNLNICSQWNFFRVYKLYWKTLSICSCCSCYPLVPFGAFTWYENQPSNKTCKHVAFTKLSSAHQWVLRENRSIPIQLVSAALKYLPYSHTLTHTVDRYIDICLLQHEFWLLLDRCKFHKFILYLNPSMMVYCICTLDNVNLIRSVTLSAFVSTILRIDNCLYFGMRMIY